MKMNGFKTNENEWFQNARLCNVKKEMTINTHGLAIWIAKWNVSDHLLLS